MNNANAHDKALLHCCGSGDIAGVRAALDAGADIEVQDVYGNTPLLWAAKFCGDEMVKLLLARGANVNAQNEEGDTALMEAASAGRLSCLKLLLDHGAKVGASGFSGTAMTIAVYSNQDDCAVYLAQAGADYADFKDLKMYRPELYARIRAALEARDLKAGTRAGASLDGLGL